MMACFLMNAGLLLNESQLNSTQNIYCIKHTYMFIANNTLQNYIWNEITWRLTEERNNKCGYNSFNL